MSRSYFFINEFCGEVIRAQAFELPKHFTPGLSATRSSSQKPANAWRKIKKSCSCPEMFPIPQPQTPPYGNTYDSLGNLTANPLPGRWTDGKNWVDYLPDVAGTFGGHFPPVTAFFPDPLNDNATNFAIGGSTSGDVNVAIGALYGFQTQISAYVRALSQGVLVLLTTCESFGSAQMISPPVLPQAI
jgi:hypothetical protein